MKALWRNAAVKDDGVAEKKRKTGESEEEEEEEESEVLRGQEADNWKHGVVFAFERRVGEKTHYEPKSDAYFAYFVDVIKALAKPHPIRMLEIRLHPGLYIKFRRSPDFEFESEDEERAPDLGELNYYMFFLSEDDEEGTGNADVSFELDRDYGSFINGDDQIDIGRHSRDGYEHFDAEELINFIRATRLGITEIGLCCTIVDAQTVVAGPFNKVWRRRDELAELDIETEDFDEASAPPFLVVGSKQ